MPIDLSQLPDQGLPDTNADLLRRQYRTVPGTPDGEATVQDVSARTGIPSVTVRNRPEEAQRIANEPDWAKMETEAPNTVGVLSRNPNLFNVAHDDVENLSGFEKSVSAWGRIGSAAKSAYDLATGLPPAVAGAASRGLDRANLAQQVFYGIMRKNGLAPQEAPIYVPRGDTTRVLNDYASSIYQDSNTEMQKAQQGLGVFGRGIVSGTHSLMLNAPFMALAVATRNPEFALTPMMLTTGGQAYQKAIDSGVNQEQAVAFSVMQGAVERWTEQFPLTGLIGDIEKGTGFLMTMGKNIVKENIGEQFATHLQDMNEWATLHPEASVMDYLKARPSAALETAIATTFASALQGGGSYGVGRLTQTYEEKQYQIAVAERGKVMAEKLTQLATESKVRERAPAEFESALAEAMKDSPVTEVIIDAQKLGELYQDRVGTVLADIGVSQEEFNQAVVEQRDIHVPISQFAARLAAKPETKAMLDHIRFTEDGYSAAEAKVVQKDMEADLQKQTETLLAEVSADEAVRLSMDTVVADVKQRLTKSAMQPGVAEANATYVGAWYARLGASEGITPQEAYAKYPFNLANERLPGIVLEQERQPIDTPEFKAWFGESKVVDDSGAPIVVYHGTGANIESFDNSLATMPDKNKGGVPWFSSAPEVAGNFAGYQDGSVVGGVKLGNSNIVPVYLSIRNPFIDERGQYARSGGLTRADVAELEAEGYDGIIWPESSFDLPDTTDDGPVQGYYRDRFGRVFGNDVPYPNQYAVFSPTQIKSATGNRGTYDPNDPNILNQDAAPRDSATHVLGVKRGERQTNKTVVLTEGEKAFIKEAAAAMGSTEAAVRAVVEETKKAHPARGGWATLTFMGAELNLNTEKYEYKWQEIPYQFNVGENGRALDPASPEYLSRVNAVSRRMVDEVLSIYHRAAAGDETAQKIIAQAGWYREMRARLRHEFGGLGDLFADLLGATSPNTPVRDNWTNAVDSLRRAMRGDYDTLIAGWVAWDENLKREETSFRAWFEEQSALGDPARQEEARLRAERDAWLAGAKERGQTKTAAEKSDKYKDFSARIKAAKDEAAKYGKGKIKDSPEYEERKERYAAARELPDELVPLKESGKKYGFNGKNVVRAMLDLWRTVREADPDIGRGGQAPKALNFSGNLIGFRERATIDVWAARMLQRLAGLRRIPSVAEGGVSGNMNADGSTTLAFGFGQDVFTKAAREIRVDPLMSQDQNLARLNDDDLQALVWFIEKEVWTKHNWTSAAGEGGSFEFEANLTGSKAQQRIRDLRKTIDASGSTPDQKHMALVELKQLERTVDRYQAGLSIQQSADTQGADFVPSDADMARLGNAIRTAIYEGDPENVVLASKALSTQGRYGGTERSLDVEVVVREGYDPRWLWRQTLVAARDARQDSTFISRVLRSEEAPDLTRHRPGVEIYFKSALTGDNLESLLAELATNGVEMYTISVDGRILPAAMSGEMPPAVGVRFQYVPEFDVRYGGMGEWADLKPAEIASKIQAKADEMADLAREVVVRVPGVTYAGQLWYDTDVRFAHEYQDTIDSLPSRPADPADQSAGSEAWRGRPLREALESAARQSEIADRIAAESRDAARRDAQLDPSQTLAQSATDALDQQNRGSFSPSTRTITLLKDADLSTFLHEFGHFQLEVMADIASRPDAPAQIKEDMDALLKWFGVADLATWKAMSLEEMRPHHEKFARGMEAYLFKGESPNAELRQVFARFRAWLIQVYKSIKALNVTLTPEVTQVFDRMLASEESIKAAEETRGYRDVFGGLEQAMKLGVSEETWRAIQAKGAQATSDAVSDLDAKSLQDMQWLANAKARELKKLQSKHDKIRKEMLAAVRAEVEPQPIYQALRWLKTGETAVDGETIKAAKGFKLNTDDLKSMYPETGLDNPDLTKLRGLTSPEGLPVAVVADMFGFTPDGLVKGLISAEPLDAVVEKTTDQRMLEQHGELVDPKAVERAAEEAIHNQARLKFVLAQHDAIQAAVSPKEDTGRRNKKGTPLTGNAVLRAAKEYAAKSIAGQTIKNLGNLTKYTMAEARAGKAAAAAARKGDTEAAAAALRSQILASALYSEALRASGEIQKILAFFKMATKFGDKASVEKGRDPDVVNAIKAILAEYGIAEKKGKTALEYLEIVKDRDPTMYGVIEPAVTAARQYAKPVNELTMEELRGLHEELQTLWNLARGSRTMEVGGDLMEIEDAEAELVAQMETKGPLPPPPGETGAMTPKEDRVRWLQFARAISRRVESWAEAMDGKFGGAFTRLVFQPVKQAADKYRAQRVVYRKKYQALVDAVSPHLKPGLIAAPELRYTFGKGHNGVGMAELLHAILHTGNESNKRKLLVGRGWATELPDGTLDTGRWDAFLARAHRDGILTKEHYDFAQGVWDLLEELKGPAQDTHRKVFGRYFAEITAEPIITPFGIYRGGYVPAQADPRLVPDADIRKLHEMENESMAFSFPATNKGFTKGRVKYDRPLILDLRMIGQHIDKVLLFTHMEPAVRDVQKLLTRKAVSGPLAQMDPSLYGGMLLPWLNRSAHQQVETPIIGAGKIDSVASSMRRRAGMSLMFANVSNTLQQITGFSVASVKVKPGNMRRALVTYIKDTKKTSQFVADSSDFMRNRMENEISAINDSIDKILLDPSVYERAQSWATQHSYFLQTAMANTMEPIIWTAAYNEHLEKTGDEKVSVSYADNVIRTTQGSTLPEDVSRIETGPSYARVFTQFFGYFNMVANTNATALQQIADEVGLKKGYGRAFYVVMMGLLVPIWVAESIAQAMRGGPPDEDDDGYLDDWLATVFGFGTIRGLLAMVPFAGQAANAAINRMNKNPMDDRISLSPAVSLLEAAAGTPVSVYKAVAGTGSKQKAVRDVATLVGILTGLPTIAVSKPLGYWVGVADDRIDPTGPVDAVRGTITGTASQESRQ